MRTAPNLFDLPLKSTTEISIATLVVMSFFLASRPPSPWFPALLCEERTYVNDRNENVVQILPKTDASVSDYLDQARWRHDFPPPPNIVAEQLAAASLHQANDGEKKSLRWLPDEKKWEFLEPHDTDWLLVDFLSEHDDRRAGPWQHAKAQGRTLSNLFHARFPHVAPKKISVVRSIPVSVSSRDLSDLHGDLPTCWQEPVKPFTVRFTDWDGRVRRMRIKPDAYDRNYFCKERMQQEGIQLVRENSIIKLVSDALGGARFKPVDDPLEYLQSFVPEDVPLHPTADPQALHEVDKEKFARRAAQLRQFAANYERSPTLQVGSLSKPTKAQLKEWNRVLAKHGLKSELSGMKWQAPKSASVTCPAEKEVERTKFEEALRDVIDADLSIVNTDDSECLRKLEEHGEVFRQFYGNNPDPKKVPELKRDLYLFETALSKNWKSDAEKKEWQRRLDIMHYFIHGVCPTGTCGINNRCANPKLSPRERLWTHAGNLLQKVAPHKMAQLKVGTFYIVVVRQGQPRLEILKAKTWEQASTEFDRLVESKVKHARASARRQNKSEKQAEQGVRDAYRVADLLYVAAEIYPQSRQQDAAAD